MPLTKKLDNILIKLSEIHKQIIEVTDIQKSKLYHTLKHMLLEADPKQKAEIITKLQDNDANDEKIQEIIKIFSNENPELTIIEQIKDRVEAIDEKMPVHDQAVERAMVKIKGGCKQYGDVRLLTTAYLKLIQNGQQKIADAIKIDGASLSAITRQHKQDNLSLLTTDLYKTEDNISKKEQLKAAIARGAYIDNTDKNGHTALHLAVRHSDEGITGLILAEGANPNMPNHKNNTPLYWAIKYRYNEDTAKSTVKELLDHGAKLDTQNYRGNTVLHLAAEKNYLEIIALLIKRGASRQILNKQSKAPIKLIDSTDDNTCLKLHEIKQSITKSLKKSTNPNIQKFNDNTNLEMDEFDPFMDMDDDPYNDYSMVKLELAQSLNILVNPMTKMFGEISTLLGYNQEQTNSYISLLYATMKLGSFALAYSSGLVATPTTATYLTLTLVDVTAKAVSLGHVPEIVEDNFEYLGLKQYANSISTAASFATYYTLDLTSINLWSIANKFTMLYVTNLANDYLTIDYQFTGQYTLGFGAAAIYQYFYAGEKLLVDHIAETTIGANVFSMIAQILGKMIFNHDTENSKVDNSEVIGDNVANPHDEL